MFKSIIWASVGIAIGLGIGIFYSASNAKNLHIENSKLVERTLNLSYKIQQQSQLIVDLQTRLAEFDAPIEPEIENTVALEAISGLNQIELNKEEKIANLERDKKDLEQKLEGITQLCQAYKKEENYYSEINPCEWLELTKQEIVLVEEELKQLK